MVDYEQDYILRLIQRVGVFFRNMIRALREHRPDDALTISEDALHHITGLSSDAAATMRVENLLVMLSAGGVVDVKRALLLAEVFLDRAEACDQLGDAAAADGERAKVKALAEAAAHEAPNSDDGDKARMLLTQIGAAEAPGNGQAASE